ncbi:MAG: hypothetical protein ACYDER_12070 [Ktedonobacteraceae bacterium]
MAIVMKFVRKRGFRTRCCGHHIPWDSRPLVDSALFQETSERT